MKAGRRRRSAAGEAGPSKFFIIALLTGLLLLAWVAVRQITRPAKTATPATATAPPAQQP